MGIFKPFKGDNYSLLKHLKFCYAFGLVGFYYELHHIFVEKQHDGLAYQTAKGFLIGAIVGFCTYTLSKYLPNSSLRPYVNRLVGTLAYILIASITYYAAYVTYSNSKYLYEIGFIGSGIKFYMGYFILSLALTLFSKNKSLYTFTKASLISFFGISLFIFTKVNMLGSLLMAYIYAFYLYCLGRLVLACIEKFFQLKMTSDLEKVILSIIYGIIFNYLIWYCLGTLAMLYSWVAMGIVGSVLLAGTVFYGKTLRKLLKQTQSEWSRDRTLDFSSAILFNIILFSMVIIFIVLSIKLPGNIDSRMHMYGGTVYRFAALHRIAFLPFAHNWTLIFQPLMFEVTGLPLFLIGGISAWRAFNVMCFFSFIPLVVLLRRSYNLSYRTVILIPFLYISSSFTFNMAYSDKPEVMAFPAFLSLLIICLLMLKRITPFYILAFGGLAGIIYNTKMVLFIGCLVVMFLLLASYIFNKTDLSALRYKRLILISFILFFTVCSVHATQNIILRGNPFHPFSSGIFAASNDFPEEVQYTEIPDYYYRRTMPVYSPSLISGINLDTDWGLYQPFMRAKYPAGQATYWHSRYFVNPVIILTYIALPILLILTSCSLKLFCSLVAMMCFFIWFGWIGDGLRYTTFFPAFALMTALIFGNQSLPNKILDKTWRGIVRVILIFTVPLAMAATLEKNDHTQVFNYVLRRDKAPELFRQNFHPVTSYLNDYKQRKPILLVADIKIPQFGCYQPNFSFQPYYSFKPMNMVYFSKIKPTHLLSDKDLENSIVIRTYPSLRAHLALEKRFESSKGELKLYRFESGVPWQEYFASFSQHESYSQGLIRDIDRFRSWYLSVSKPELGQHRQTP